MKKKITATVLVILMTVTLFSCGPRGPVAMEYEDVYVTEAMYGYWLSHYKAVFMENFSDVKDTDEFWNSEVSGGMTAEEYFTEIASENIKKNIAAAWLFDYMGLSFTSSMKKEIKAGIDDLCETLFDGDTKEFNAYLSEYGIDSDDLYDIYVMDAKVNYAYDYLYGDRGIMSIPDDYKLSYTKDNYSHIVHIYVNNNFKYVTVENELGTLTHDPETGEPYTEKLSEDEKAKKDATIEAIDKAIDSGEDFIKVWDKYSEDKLYSDGYYLQKDTNFIKEVVDAAFELEIGEVVRLKTDYGVHYVKRLPVEGTPWDDKANNDFFGSFDDDIAEYYFTSMIEESSAEVKVNAEITGKYALRDVKPNYYI